MPRQLITAPGADRKRSLGWLALWFIETFIVHGPGDVEGDAIRHGDEYSGFIVDCYSLDGVGRRMHDSAFFSRPKGCNKSGLAAEIAIFEAVGPCRFDGWAEGGETFEFLGHVYTYEAGEPMGKPVKYPFVRIMATEEGQTGNVYDTIYRNFTDGPLAELKAYGLDVGLTRVNLPFGGEIVPSTSGAASKDGGKETFAVFDESHLYNTPELRRMYGTVTRNLTKRKKIAETWFIETTTMYLPGENSVAEETYKYMQAIVEGKARRSKLLYDHRFSDLKEDKIRDEALLRAAIEDAYGEALEWNSIDGIIDDIFDPRRPLPESIRYFLNALTAALNAWVTPAQLSAVTKGAEEIGLRPGDEITLGFDGAVSDDATALVACRVEDGLIFPLLISECPDGPESIDWRVDENEFDAKVAEAFEQFNVVGFFADPPYWQDWLDRWEKEYGEGLRVKQSPSSAIRFWTKNDTPMAMALERLHTAIASETALIFADEQLIRHFTNSRVWKRRTGAVIGKETKNSVKKIDGAMAATLAFEARARYLARSESVKEPAFVPFRVR